MEKTNERNTQTRELILKLATCTYIQEKTAVLDFRYCHARHDAERFFAACCGRKNGMA